MSFKYGGKTLMYKPLHSDTYMKVKRPESLTKLIGKTVVSVFDCYSTYCGGEDYETTIILLNDGTELNIVPDGEYGTCSLMINGGEVQ